jgi:hypothetical protein
MTAPECLSARPGAFQPSRRRASARNAEVRSNSDTSPHDAPPKMRNKTALHSAAGIRAATTVTLRPASSLTSHLALIEIP